MRRRGHSFYAVAVFAGIVLAGAMGPAFGGGGEGSDEGGGSTDPEPESTADTSWNPFNPCTVPELGESAAEFFACLGTYIDVGFNCIDRPSGGGGGASGPPGDPIRLYPPLGTTCAELDSRGDYNVSYRYDQTEGIIGINVRLDHADETGSREPYRFSFRENSANIQRTEVDVNRPNLIGKIRKIEETPHGGRIDIGINGVTHATVFTTRLMSADDVNDLIMERLLDAGVEAVFDNPAIVIYLARGGVPVTQLSFKCTDSGIKKSHILLVPAPGMGSPGGGAEDEPDEGMGGPGDGGGDDGIPGGPF